MWKKTTTNCNEICQNIDTIIPEKEVHPQKKKKQVSKFSWTEIFASWYEQLTVIKACI